MKTDFTILITDRNSHVRCFLKRELVAEGFRVIVADSGQEVLESSFSPLPIDLVVIDPDLPGMELSALLQKLSGRIPPLPVVLHTLPGDNRNAGDMNEMIVSVEKGSRSIDRLKAVIADILSPNIKTLSQTHPTDL